MFNKQIAIYELKVLTLLLILFLIQPSYYISKAMNIKPCEPRYTNFSSGVRQVYVRYKGILIYEKTYSCEESED